ncbi:MAG: four helix bundle protein [Candidatus Aenigmarchaeota archaeon]|nr:four helix bundle protein [Candidatus Aenigmarchaeota archaeon]
MIKIEIRKIPNHGNFGRGTTGFYPKRPVRSFRDLEVYQKTSQASADVMRKITPKITGKYPMADRMSQCLLTIPNLIAEAHSRRFEDEKAGLKLLDESMAECNKMVVYLEQVRDIYGGEVDRSVCEELIKTYIYSREKIFRLYKAWKKFQEEYERNAGRIREAK